jgi:hypothetical protein
MAAFRMSQVDAESPDPRVPGLVWGKGKWPSFQLAWHVYVGVTLYGPRFPDTVGFPGMYALAFRYADLIQNGGRYVGRILNQPDPGALDRYVAAVLEEHAPPLDFTVYVPPGYESVGGRPVPNVRAATDSAQVWTASFMSGRETWGVTV